MKPSLGNWFSVEAFTSGDPEENLSSRDETWEVPSSLMLLLR